MTRSIDGDLDAASVIPPPHPTPYRYLSQAVCVGARKCSSMLCGFGIAACCSVILSLELLCIALIVTHKFAGACARQTVSARAHCNFGAHISVQCVPCDSRNNHTQINCNSRK